MRSWDVALSGEGGVEEINGRLHLSEHSHAGHIYAERDQQLEVAVAFFRAGLSQRLRCVYLHDELDDRRARQDLARAGLDVDGAIQSEALEVADRHILPARPGEFDVEGLFNFARDRIHKAEVAGYAGVRGVGDMGWALAPDPGLEQLTLYESKCTGFFTAHPAAAICQYDRNRFDSEALFDVVCEHPLLIIGDTVCKNPYYVPEASFADRQRPDTDLDRVMGNVLAREREERWLAVAEVGLEVHDPDIRAVDVRHLAGIYEHMRDYKLALRERVRWRQDRQRGVRRASGRTELTALDAEIQWLAGRASLWRRRELQSSGLYFERATGTVAYRGSAIGLSRLEAALLRVLLEQAGRPCSAADLLRTAWDGDVRTEAQLRNYIVRLRTKLETLGVPAAITTHRGHGYCLTTEGSTAST